MINETHGQTTDIDLNAVLRGRTDILETRFAVAAVQIVERLRIRAQNLQKILDEDLEIGGRRGGFPPGCLLPTSPFQELDDKLRLEQSSLDRERRMEDKECWRDLTTVMRDLLNAWEGLSQAKAKERFLEGLPPAQEAPAPEPERYHFSILRCNR
jgi:hypothetical protein